MRCPECVRLGQRSAIYANKGYTTLLSCDAYYDEDGAYHYHNPNSTRSELVCSNGHRLRVVTYNACLRCSWRGGEDTAELIKEEQHADQGS